MKKNQLDYGIICDVGGKRKGNQDSLFFSEFDLIIAPGSPDSKQFSYKSILAIICDGVSSSLKGEKGSNFVIRHLAAKIIGDLYIHNFSISEELNKIQEFINQTNFELINEFKDLKNTPQTTLAGFLVIGQWLWLFNLGDSRIFIVKDGEINQISVDHIGTSASHEITQSMGLSEIKPELKIFNWAYQTKNDEKKISYTEKYYILACSDGLTDRVTNSEINEILNDQSKNEGIQEKVEILYNLSMTRGNDDNISIIAVDLSKYFDSISIIQKIKLQYEG
ncbi:PP2C family serine/threonine-protein phosphatase [Promethearchaeum syntrophicum]|uniref:PP2C family serine/threonine-protein phosphatase n=1 Tax=Promethearchaeum syntrophicum TaxID=2594042 RepID=A0A5B9D7D8_9ARCH|nr:PP2C family serine/threonine-protein phosphatase [Candidatus Prometheoarchaeum syntrophicum]QEE14935.1 Protein phosphatase 2C [Candidatus Prometheoarchaeum syntrophicum]